VTTVEHVSCLFTSKFHYNGKMGSGFSLFQKKNAGYWKLVAVYTVENITVLHGLTSKVILPFII